LQNLTPAGISAPQLEQVGARRAPHSKQKRDCGGFSCWHRRHFMPESPHAPRLLTGGIAEILLI